MRHKSSVIDATFVVRVCVDRAGRVRGTVERVKSGEKHRFETADAIGSVIVRMASAGRAGPAPEIDARPMSLPDLAP